MGKGKPRALLWIISIFGFFVVLAVVAVVVIATMDWNRAKPYVTAAVSKATGRELHINGDLLVDFGWTSRVRASRLQFENAEWSEQPQMVEVGLLDVQLDLWQLLRRFRVVLPTVTISQPKVILEKNAEGKANWEFRTAAPATAAVPQKRTTFPEIHKLIVNDGSLLFRNRQTDTELELNLSEAEAAGFLQEPLKLKAKGAYQKLPLNLTLDGGSYETLKNSKEPYPLDIDLAIGKLKAKLQGNLTEPLTMKGEDVTLDIQGDDMANLFPLIHLVFPSTPPYGLKGRLHHEGNIWTFSNFSGRVGGSDLSGTIRVDTGPERPVMKADLTSNRLDFKDLAGFIGGKPGAHQRQATAAKEQKTAGENDNDDRIFPDRRYDLERLRTMDADVRLRARQILAPDLPIDDLNAKLRLNDGVLRFEPAVFGVANGRVEIYSTFDGSRSPSKVNIDTRLHHLDLKRFLKSEFAQKTIGPMGGRIALSGNGNSFRELMATASGNMFVMMSGGEISELLVRLAGLNVARALGVLVRGDKPIPIRCALIDLAGKDGQMGVQTLAFDTDKSVVVGEGNVDLGNEKVDIVLTPVPKDFSPFSLRSFIRVNGRFKNISAFPDPIRTGTESIFQKVLNVLVLLVTSPLQPRDLGLARDVNCDALMARAQQRDPKGVILRDFGQAAETKTTADKRHASR